MPPKKGNKKGKKGGDDDDEYWLVSPSDCHRNELNFQGAERGCYSFTCPRTSRG